MKFSWDDVEQLGKRVADTLYDAADTVGKKTGEVVETQKLKNQIYTMRRENAKDWLEMGRSLYEAYKNGEAHSEDFHEICEKIREREEEILACEKKVSEMKGEARCANCHEAVQKGMNFCPFCGTKVETEEDIFEEEDTTEETLAEEEAAAAEEEIFEEENLEEIRAAYEQSLADEVSALDGKEGDL